MSKVHIVAEIEVGTEHKDGLMPVLQALVKGSRAEAGNVMYDLTESLDTPGHFFVLEIWASEQAIEEHNATAHFQAFVQAIEGKAKKLVITKAKCLF